MPKPKPEPATETEIPATPMVREIPLNQLVLSALNVRRTERDADIGTLAEDIAAHGLMQNLIVTPAHDSTAEMPDGEDWTYKFEVIAGARRMQALNLLATDGRLPFDHPVLCRIDMRSSARETSLSENLQRVAMNPADEFEAFAGIVGQSGNAALREEAIELCAKRFGKTPGYVAGRLRLADLAPDILEALRTDRIGVEAAKAYAAVSDHRLQLQVFKEREKDSYNGHKPQIIRERLRGKTLSLDDGRMVWIGIDAYRAAGGRTEVEMFMGTQGEERAIDAALLDRLVKEKAEAEIPALAKKAGYKEGLFAGGSTGGAAAWPKAPKGFERAYDYGGTPSKARLKKSVAVFAVALGGDQLVLLGRFRPKDEVMQASTYTPPTEEELAAAARDRAIDTIAARLAVGAFKGSPFEGRAFWPNSRWVGAVEHVSEDYVLVAVQVKVSANDIAGMREAAAEKYDAEQAEAEAHNGEEVDA